MNLGREALGIRNDEQIQVKEDEKGFEMGCQLADLKGMIIIYHSQSYKKWLAKDMATVRDPIL